MPNKEQYTYQNNWIKNNYDRLNIQVPKGQFEILPHRPALTTDF